MSDPVIDHIDGRSESERAEASGASGRITLEQTAGGRTLDGIDVFRTSDPLLKPADASEIWETASARYTEGASGGIHAYLDKSRDASIYNTTERPSLMEGVRTGQVSGLKEFDVAKYHDWMTK